VLTVGAIKDGAREVRVSAAETPSADFVTAVTECSRGLGRIADDEEALRTLRDLLAARGFPSSDMPDSDLQIQMQVDLDTGTTMTSVVQEAGGNPLKAEVASKLAHSLRSLLATQLASNVDTLRDALARNDSDAFVASFSHLPSEDGPVQAILDLADDALRRQDWKASHSIVAMRALNIATVTERGDDVMRYARLILALPDIDAALRFNANMALGVGHGIKGELEAAVSIFRVQLKEASPKVPTATKAWLHRNLGITLLNLGRLDEGLEEMRRAASMRASEGVPGEPGRTLGRAALAIEHHSPRTAIVLLDEIAAGVESATDREGVRTRANALYSAARIRCTELGEFADALRLIDQAIPDLCRSFEDEDLVAGAMLIRLDCAEALGDQEMARRTQDEHSRFLEERPFLQVAEFDRAFSGRDPAALQTNKVAASYAQLLTRLRRLDGMEGVGLIDEVEAMIASIDDDDRYRRRITAAEILAYLAQRLDGAGYADDAVTYYLRAVGEYPGALRIQWRLGRCLLRLQRFREAAHVGLKVAHEKPDSPHGFLLCADAAYRAADYDTASEMLAEALRLRPGHKGAERLAELVRKEKLSARLSGAIVAPRSFLGPVPPTDHAAFLTYLAALSGRIRLNSEAFWKARESDKLVQNPENVARALLAQDLAALTRAVALYKEVAVTAGRIDLIANVLGTEFIMELKICGAGYAKSYADGGFEQLRKYMIERSATRAYLIVFDARAKQEGAEAFPTQVDLGDGLTIFCVAINIRGVDTD
jgi:tetratricopeptide (TPR) repeat protein